MKQMNYVLMALSALGATGLLGIQTSQARGGPISVATLPQPASSPCPSPDPSPTPDSTPVTFTILSCNFEQEIPKAEDLDCSATLTLVAPPLIPGVQPTPPGSPPNQFIITCGHRVIYDGGAFFTATELSPQFASSVIAANTNIQPGYPAVWVDGDINGLSFHDRDAHLEFNGHELIRGTCDHEGITR